MTTDEDCADSIDYPHLAAVVDGIHQVGHPARVEAPPDIRSSLRSLGFAPGRENLLLLSRVSFKTMFPWQLTVLRELCQDQGTREIVLESRLPINEQLIALLRTKQIRERVTAAFLRQYVRCNPDPDTDMGPRAAVVLAAAIRRGGIAVPKLESYTQYEQHVRAAEEWMHSDRNVFPRFPVQLPGGWRWLNTGREVSEALDKLGDARWFELWWQPEQLEDGSEFLATDPAGGMWRFARCSSPIPSE